MKSVLVLFTSSYPFGEGEAFVANEVPYLASAYDEVLVVSNDVHTPSSRPVPERTTVARLPYHPAASAKLRALAGVFSPMVWRELAGHRRRGMPTTRVLATALTSWAQAGRVARLLRDVASRAPETEVHAYSYWANDMAVGCALARRNGWVDRAWCRAHGWDAYPERTGYLPFRHFLATHLDHYLFVSEHGRRRFEALLGRSYPSVGVARLGTPPAAPGSRARLRPFTVVSCSALIPLKRVELVAGALARVRAPTS